MSAIAADILEDSQVVSLRLNEGLRNRARCTTIGISNSHRVSAIGQTSLEVGLAAKQSALGIAPYVCVGCCATINIGNNLTIGQAIA